MSFLRRIFRGGPHDGRDEARSPDDLVPLARVDSEFEATLFRDMLRDAGIQSMVKNRDALSIYLRMTPRPQMQELWVMRKDLQLARVVLELGDDNSTQDP